MKNKKIVNVDKILSISLGVVFLFVMLFVFFGFLQSARNNDFNRKVNPPNINENWEYKLDNKVETVSFPGYINCKYGETVLIKNIIPSDFVDGSYIYIHTDSCSVDAYIDGAEIENIGVDYERENKKYENPITVLVIPNGSQGKEISMHIKNNGSKFRIEIYDILYGVKNEIRFGLTSSQIPIICASVTMIVLALVLIVYAFYIRGKYRSNSDDYLFLSAFVLFSAIWIYTDLNIQGAYYVGSKSHYLATIFSYMLFPIPLIMFVNRQFEKRDKILRLLTTTHIVFIILVMLFFLFDIFKLAYVLLVSHILVTVLIAYVLAILIRNTFVYKKRAGNMLLFAMASLGITGVATIFNFYYNYNSDNTFAFKYGLMIFTVVMTVQALIKAFTSMTKEKTLDAAYMLNEEVNIIKNKKNSFVAKYYIQDNLIVYTDNDVEKSITPQEFIRKNSTKSYANDIMAFFYSIMQGVPKGEVSFEGTLLNNKGFYNLDYEIVSNKDKKAVYALLNFTDITEYHNLEEILKQGIEEAKTVVRRGGSYYQYNLSKDNIVEYDNNVFTAYLKTNASLKEFSEYIASYVNNEADKALVNMMFSFGKLYSIYGRTGSQDFDVRVKIDNIEKWLKFTIWCFLSPNAKDVICLFQVEDSESVKKYVVDSSTGIDRITELLNANSFKTEVKVLLENLDNSKCHTLMLLQIDDFDNIIEEYGNSVSNLILKDTANKLKIGTRSSDTIARIGIDSFALFIPDTPLNNGGNKILVKRICDELKKKYYDKFELTASCGVALYPYDGLTFDNLMINAKLALEKAKEDGKGSIEFFNNDIKEEYQNDDILNKILPLYNYANLKEEKLKLSDEEYKTVVIFKSLISDNIYNILNKKYLIINANTVDDVKNIFNQETGISSLIFSIKNDEDYNTINEILKWKNENIRYSSIAIVCIVEDDKYENSLYIDDVNDVIKENELQQKLENSLSKINAKRKNVERQTRNIVKAFIEKNS